MLMALQVECRFEVGNKHPHIRIPLYVPRPIKSPTRISEPDVEIYAHPSPFRPQPSHATKRGAAESWEAGTSTILLHVSQPCRACVNSQ